MNRWIMHVDMDAFYASVEQRDRPDLRGRPVVVGARPGQRGVVATCSYEARRFGIHSAMPIAEAYRRCPQAVYLRPDMGRYSRESRRVMDLLGEFSPVVEPVSIDEAYVDLTGTEGLFGPFQAVGQQVKTRIREALGLGASVGIGPNRLIAKLASDHRKPDGLTIVPPEEVLDFLGPMPVERLRGVGARTLERLQRIGIARVEQLHTCPAPLLVDHLGRRSAESLLRQAAGLASDNVGGDVGRKSISVETTFEVDVREPGRLKDTLRQLACELGGRARKEALAGHRIGLKIRFSGFETHTLQRRQELPTNSDRELFKVARSLWEEAWSPGRGVRLLGIALSDWDDAAPGQMDLFDEGRDPVQEDRLWQTVDQVRERFGSGKLGLGMPRGKRKVE